MPYKNKEQQKIAQAAWYQYKKIALVEKQRLRRAEGRDFIRKYKEANSRCVDCKVSYPPHVLDFDHLGDKQFSISAFGKGNKTKDEIETEILKCEIVCANCHRIRTWARKMGGRSVMVALLLCKESEGFESHAFHHQVLSA
jgi:hypothetical protein